VADLEWHIVIAASSGYEPGLKAFLNSFKKYHPESDIIIHCLGLELKQDLIEDYPWVNHVKLDWVNVVPRNTAWSTKIPRFKYAAELNGIVMLADADMFFCSSMNNYFKIAEQGFIVAGANGSNFQFGQNWRDKYQIDMPDIFWHKTITSVPTILDTKLHGQVWMDLYNHKMTIGTGADFDLQNIFMAKHNKLDDIVVLPSQQVTGVHHFYLKPDTRIVRKCGKLMTNDGLELLMVHGKWWQEGWFNQLMITMQRYCQTEKCIKGAEDSRKTLKQEFDSLVG